MRSGLHLEVIWLAMLLGVAGACAGAHERAATARAGSTAAAQAATPTTPPSALPAGIVLPEMLAIEMPAAGQTTIAPADSPLRELLAAAKASSGTVTHDLTRAIGTGATEVTWTAWAGAPGQSAAAATRTAKIFVLPFGQSPAGLTADDRGTASNHSPKIVRDAAGKAHMVWMDSGRPGVGSRVMYRRAALHPTTGALTWETEPLRLSEPANEQWNGYPVIAASANVVHVAWAGTTVQYRRLVRRGDAWVIEPTVDTRVAGPGEDWGPGLTVRGDDEIHLLTPSGRYAISRDGGRTWISDAVPVPAGLHMKGPAMAVDSDGNVHVTFTGKVRSSPTGWKYGGKHASYWQLRYVRRRAAGGWEDAQNLLGGLSEWADSGTQDDVLADFSDVAVDRSGNVHVGWHGSGFTRAYSYDEAFYVRRERISPGIWGPLGPTQSLQPHDPPNGDYFSYAPSLSFDEQTGTVLAVIFYDTVPNVGSRFDASLRVLRHGRTVGPRVLLTQGARDPVRQGRPQEAWSVWFPCAARTVYRGADGRAWLDVVQTVVTSLDYQLPHHVVYLRRDVTALLAQGG